MEQYSRRSTAGVNYMVEYVSSVEYEVPDGGIIKLFTDQARHVYYGQTKHINY